MRQLVSHNLSVLILFIWKEWINSSVTLNIQRTDEYLISCYGMNYNMKFGALKIINEIILKLWI